MRVALPAKGRLREPAFRLLEDAGLGPEQPGDRALAFPCRNAPVEVLLVRAADIPEYVQDGVVDCGITGIDLVRERGAEVRELLPLGFGSCRLEAAVPEEASFRTLDDLAGASVATVYPRLARELLPVDVSLVDVTGSVEIAPRLGRADLICDLVSTGSTLAANHLRRAETVLDSQAVLIRTPVPIAAEKQEWTRRLLMRIDGVEQVKGSKYIMLHAPRSALAAIAKLLPGSEAPTVIPLEGRGDRVAVHAVCRESVFWETLEDLKGAGATSVLVLPVEKMLA